MNRLAVIRLVLLAPLIFGNSILANAQDDSIYRLPTGTRIHLKMDAELSSKVASVNDTFIASVSRPVIRRNVLVLPAGTLFEGRVVSASAASGATQDGTLEVRFDTIKLEGMPRNSIDGRLVNHPFAKSSSLPTVLSILGGAAAGAIIGGLAHSGSGALIGAGVGAGAGTGIALARKGRESRILKDEEFEIELKKDVVLPVKDY
jgi:hypothetical protein